MYLMHLATHPEALSVGLIWHEARSAMIITAFHVRPEDRMNISIFRASIKTDMIDSMHGRIIVDRV